MKPLLNKRAEKAIFSLMEKISVNGSYDSETKVFETSRIDGITKMALALNDIEAIKAVKVFKKSGVMMFSIQLTGSNFHIIAVIKHFIKTYDTLDFSEKAKTITKIDKEIRMPGYVNIRLGNGGKIAITKNLTYFINDNWLINRNFECNKSYHPLMYIGPVLKALAFNNIELKQSDTHNLVKVS